MTIPPTLPALPASAAAWPRRFFLKTAQGVGFLGAVAALAGRARPVQAAPAPAEPAAQPVDGHYHETEHIRKYYAAARYF
jgi:hypothetical protein